MKTSTRPARPDPASRAGTRPARNGASRVRKAIATTADGEPGFGAHGGPDERARIWQAVHSIPEGRVSTYGAIATLAGLPGRARLVGRVLSQLPEDTRLPWHRVVNASGRISRRTGADGSGEVLQAERLRAEGVLFASTRVDLARLGWPDGTRER